MGKRLVCAVGMLTLLGWTCEQLRAAASWVGQPYALSIPTHLTSRGQSVSGSVVMTLSHDGPCILTISAAGAGQEVLRNGTAVLATSYKITGPSVWNDDSNWVNSTDFLSRSYLVLGAHPADAITFWVRGTAPPNAAPQAGAYSAAIVVTVSW